MKKRVRVVNPKYLVNVNEPEMVLFRDTEMSSRSRIKDHVELPMVKAVEYLFDLGIQSASCGACANEVKNGYAFLQIKYDSLSEENKAIAKKLGIVREAENKTVYIRIDVNQNTTIEYVENVTHAYVSHFKPQRAYWAIVDTNDIEEYMKNHNETRRVVIGLFKYYEDPKGRLWLSEELYNINRPRPWVRILD